MDVIHSLSPPEAPPIGTLIDGPGFLFFGADPAGHTIASKTDSFRHSLPPDSLVTLFVNVSVAGHRVSVVGSLLFPLFPFFFFFDSLSPPPQKAEAPPAECFDDHARFRGLARFVSTDPLNAFCSSPRCVTDFDSPPALPRFD